MFRRRRRLLDVLIPEKRPPTPPGGSRERYVVIPKLAYEYAKGMAKISGLPLSEVLRSEPFKAYLEKMREKVKIRVG